jgi:hypothetical protein
VGDWFFCGTGFRLTLTALTKEYRNRAADTAHTHLPGTDDNARATGRSRPYSIGLLRRR